ncbi:TPA: hypothetical protein ACSHSI_003176 [Serratia marcescens]
MVNLPWPDSVYEMHVLIIPILYPDVEMRVMSIRKCLTGNLNRLYGEAINNVCPENARGCMPKERLSRNFHPQKAFLLFAKTDALFSQIYCDSVNF